MYTVAFDPGMKNLGVWRGNLDQEGFPITDKLCKFDIVEDKKKPLYEAAVDLVMEHGWMTDRETVAEAVVETQEPRNIPARIAAVAIYGALRGMGVKTCFSGSALKNKAMADLSEKLALPMEPKPDKLPKDADPKEKARRKRLMHKVNKDNSKMLVRGALVRLGDERSKRVLDGAGGKEDDLADAMLLGVGLCASRLKGVRKCRVKKCKEDKKKDGPAPVH